MCLGMQVQNEKFNYGTIIMSIYILLKKLISNLRDYKRSKIASLVWKVFESIILLIAKLTVALLHQGPRKYIEIKKTSSQKFIAFIVDYNPLWYVAM